MMHRNGRAALTATLVADRRAQLVDRLVTETPAAAAASAPTIALFPTKRAAPDVPKAGRAALAALPDRAPRPRMSLRLTQNQLWRMRLAAAYLRQSCQDFAAGALDRQIARLASDPAHASLAALLEAPAGNG